MRNLTLSRKNIFLCLFIFSFCQFLSAQDHSTITSLDVTYRQTDFPNDSIILYRSQSTIILKQDSNVVVLHFKITNESGTSVIYQTDYLLNSPVITNTEGVILFKKEASSIYIASATEIPLNAYRYEITTEDAYGNVTEVFTEFK